MSRRDRRRAASRSRRAREPADARFRAALSLHRAGRPADAEAACRRLLARSPRHLDGLQLLGLLRHQQGDPAGALEPLETAVTLAPRLPYLHNNLGEVLRALGRHDEALACYRRALGLDRRLAEARLNAGLTLLALGRPAEAETEFRDLLAVDAGNLKARSNLAAALVAQGRHQAAAAASRALLAIDPGDVRGHVNLGAALLGDGDAAGACEAFARALALEPDNTDALYDLGNARRDLGELAAAEASYRRCLALRPGFTPALNNLGTCLRSQLKLDAARTCFDEVLRRLPEDAEAHFNRALVDLLVGDFAAGLEDYEYRWRLKSAAPARNFPCPAWDGGPVEGRTVLLHAEQGYGDAIQFVRYAGLLADRGARVVVECRPALRGLLGRARGVAGTVALGDAPDDTDFQAPLMSLPRLFGTRLETIPDRVPYIAPPDARVPPAAPGVRLKVGIVWAGSPKHENDRNRSCRLADFAPLARLPGVALYSLQTGPRAAELGDAAELAAVDLGAALDDFEDTAAALCGLDLVVTVDTAVAHLAGALGWPVWVLLPRAPDWRWLLERADCPWYPTMRLWRQGPDRTWPPVFERLAAALAAAVPP